MRKQGLAITVLLFIVSSLWCSTESRAQDRQQIEGQRLAQTGMKFLSASPDARAAALADAVTASLGSSVSLFYNPAGMAYIDKTTHVTLGRLNWIGDINYNIGSVAFRPFSGRYGTVGVSVMEVGYGEVLSTIRADNQDGYENVGTVEPSGLAAGLGYARTLTDRFAVGGHVKYVRQSLGASIVSQGEDGNVVENHEKGALAVDFGVLYRTGFRSLNFAVSVRNFSRELTYAEDSFELPLTFRVGVSMDLLDVTPFASSMHSALLTVDATRYRDYPEQLKTGLEYRFMDILALRAGYSLPRREEEGINLGAGIHSEFAGIGFGFDYAYTPFGVFGTVNRIGIQLEL